MKICGTVRRPVRSMISARRASSCATSISTNGMPRASSRRFAAHAERAARGGVDLDAGHARWLDRGRPRGKRALTPRRAGAVSRARWPTPRRSRASPAWSTSWRACARPGGCPWDREQTPESLRPYLVEEAYEVARRDRPRRPRRRCATSWATCSCRSSSTPRSPPRRGHFDLADVARAHRRQARAPPSARLRRRPGPRRRRGRAQLAAHQGRGAARRGGDAADGPARVRARRPSRPRPRAAGGREARARRASTGPTSPACSPRSTRSAASCDRRRPQRGPRRPRARELGDLLLTLDQRGAPPRRAGRDGAARRHGPAGRRASGTSRRRARARRAARSTRLDDAERDRLWDAAEDAGAARRRPARFDPPRGRVVTAPPVANHASALKRHRQTVKRTKRNQALRTRLRHFVRAVRQAVAGKDATAAPRRPSGAPPAHSTRPSPRASSTATMRRAACRGCRAR